MTDGIAHAFLGCSYKLFINVMIIVAHSTCINIYMFTEWNTKNSIHKSIFVFSLWVNIYTKSGKQTDNKQSYKPVQCAQQTFSIWITYMYCAYGSMKYASTAQHTTYSYTHTHTYVHSHSYTHIDICIYWNEYCVCWMSITFNINENWGECMHNSLKVLYILLSLFWHSGYRLFFMIEISESIQIKFMFCLYSIPFIFEVKYAFV